MKFFKGTRVCALLLARYHILGNPKSLGEELTGPATKKCLLTN